MSKVTIFGLLWLSLNTASHAQATIDVGFIKQYYKTTLAGAATTVALHELGHFAVAETESVHAEFDGTTIVYPDQSLNEKQRLRLSSAGYQSQWLASEYAFTQLNNTPNNQNKAFHTGMILGHIGISLAYLTVLKSHENGDSLGTASAAKLSEEQVLLSLAIPALLDSWRLFGKHKPKWLAIASKASKAIGITAIWTF